MKKIAGIAAMLMVLSTSLAFAQANPNGGVTTGSPSTESETHSQTAPGAGNPNTPGR
jgi:hypothetical protein